jgi:integrase
VLADAELATLWTAAGKLGAPWPGVIRLMLLTGQRRGEVAGMRWAEVDLDAGLWALPGERTKNGRSHTVPLAPAAVDLLRGLNKRKGAVLVFEGARRTVPSGFGKVAVALSTALAVAEKDEGRKPVPFVLHDLRRSVATGFQRLGIRLEVTEAMLNHVSGSRSGIVGVYQRHGWEREKAAAAEAWASHLMAAVAGAEAAGNVVAFAAVKRTRAKRRADASAAASSGG